ncbi:MAG: SLC26A/SulP transporter family protein [Bacteroidia bacterium]
MGSDQKSSAAAVMGDVFGGTAAMLVALPSAIAFGLIIYAPLGPSFSSKAALGGIIGTIALGMLAPLFGGTKRLVSAPCAPAAAVLAVFVSEMVSKGTVQKELIPVYIALIAFFTGVVQITLGKLGGGKIIKYIPYPVVTGYLSGVGVLIFIGQLPKLAGIAKGVSVADSLTSTHYWNWECIVVGGVTIVTMLLISKIIKIIPAAIIALVTGIGTYFLLSIWDSSLLRQDGNTLIIGPVSASLSSIGSLFSNQWTMMTSLHFSSLGVIFIPVLTLAVLLSIDTLKTCVVLDALTYTRHNSNKELVGQGMGNISSALLCGIPGAGTMGATLVNMNSGAKTKLSGVIVGFSALLVLLLFGKLVAWIPISALAGILIVVAIRMLDYKSLSLLKHKTTVFDFCVILGVVIAAVTMSLIAAAGVGIALAIVLFLREQMRTSVIRRKAYGNQLFSKKSRVTAERAILEAQGIHTLIMELQGQLFFGTADQLLAEIEPLLGNSKYVLLDMRRVQSVDYTAANRIKQILGRIKDQDGFLIFTSVPLSLPSGQNVKEYIERLGLSENEHIKYYDNLDSALEWVEDEILTEQRNKDDKRILKPEETELLTGFSGPVLGALLSCLEQRNMYKDEEIFKIHEEGDEIFIVGGGEVKIVLPLDGGATYHLVTITKGGFFGDMAFLDKRKRSANAIVSEEAVLYILKRQTFDKVCAAHPEIAGKFFEKLAFVISNRLRLSDIELKTLQES